MIKARTLLLCAALATAAPALAQRIGQGSGAEVPIWRVVGALALCLALALVAAYALRRRLGGAMPRAIGGTRRLQLVETLRLSHQTDLCLVRCDGADMLIAATPHGASTIAAGLSPSPDEADA